MGWVKFKRRFVKRYLCVWIWKPSPIQQKGILPIVKGKDVIAQAQSGTGKTGAFTVATLQKIDETVDELQGLIMAPTRELAIQIHSVLKGLSSFMSTLKINLSIGGKAIEENNDKSHIIVGTPGRVLDMIRRKKST